MSHTHRTPTRSRTLMGRLIAALAPNGFAYYCEVCEIYYNPADPGESYPHNNH
ncbi:hypothetical protein ACFXKD_13685 [Nocardiopsis aegyptia]|uniref:hypothetical protein n=1 Tax=Nocardiopsis aegyptia TaxID=220378 RepID=UPI0036729F40